MNVEGLELVGACLITTKAHRDERGLFTERFRMDKWQELFPGHPGFVQENYSWSAPRVLRGLHYQFAPAQGKLVTCVEGAVTDVIVDIRRDSPTFGRHLMLELTAEAPRWLWIPPGFAHGFAVTSEAGAGLLYKVDAYYQPAGEGAIAWNDPELAIAWPLSNPVVSDKDQRAGPMKAYRQLPKF